MRIIDPGHRYGLHLLDTHGQRIEGRLQFVKREGERYPGNVGAYPGTTSQEVLRALIDRAKYVNRQIPCWQTRLSVWLYRAALWLYEHRAAGTHGRGFPLRRLPMIERFGACPQCGHIGCQEHV